MKVLHVIHSLSLVRGGPTVAALQLVKALRDSGVDAEAIATNDNGDGVLDVPLEEKIEYSGIPVRFFSRTPSRIKAIYEYGISQSLTRWLEANIHRYDLVKIHSLFTYVCTFSAIISRQHKVPYIIAPHGHFSPWVIGQKRLKKQVYAFLLERKNLHRAAAIHCLTDREAKYVRDYGVETPTFSLPLGIDPPDEIPQARKELRDRYSLPESTPIILFLSRLHPKKRLDFLLQVLSEMKDSSPFHFLLAGSGDPDYVSYLSQRIDALNLRSRVTEVGFVRGRDKDLLLQGSDLFLLPSFGENFGIAVVEAAVSGLPMIITPEVEIASEIADANAGLIVPGQAEKWRRAIAQLLASVSQRQELGNNGRQLALKQYNWQAIGQQLAEIYQEIINTD